jgi:predicted TIM-barrel fold metal-dependent hydrolase
LLKFFDCDAAYGRGTTALPKEVETADTLAAELAHCGIAEALVWHRDAFERDFDTGNCRLVKETASQPRLHPTFAWVPTCCDEMHPVDTFVGRLRDEGVRAVRAFPVRHYFVLDRVACGDLLDAFCAHNVPVLVPLAEFADGWYGVYRLMREFPQLTLILTATGCWGQDRYFRPLMREYPRFHLSLNRFETAGQLEGVVNAVGPDRLVYGSGLPWNYPGGGILMVHRARVPDAAKEAIAHGNIERLLGEVPW